ncbi:MAG: M28 family peptidase [Chitinophagaceae bacterium]
MLKLVTAFWLIQISSSVIAQSSPEKYAAIITATELKKHLGVIAGPDMEGRETATEGQKKAAAYIEEYFKSLNLLTGNGNSYQQVFSLSEDSMATSTIKVGKNELIYGKDYMMSARANKTRQVTSSKIVFAGYGISDSAYNDYDLPDVKGAIVVLSTGVPGSKNISPKKNSSSILQWSMGRKLREAYNQGAAGVFIISPGMATIDSGTANAQRFSGAYLPRDQKDESIGLNYAFISHAFFSKIFGSRNAKKLLEKSASTSNFLLNDYIVIRENITFTFSRTSYEKGTSSNVLAVLEGSDKKDEYVLLTAHYDHLGKKGDVIYYGADDDGSGTTSVLAMASAFAKAKEEGNGPRRTIVFMTVSGEEEGLWGSEYYSDHPIFPLDKTTVNLNTDMVGRIDPKRTYGDSLNYLYVIGDDKTSSDLKTISESINTKYTHLELDYKYNDPKDPERIFYRSDHYNFARKGIPILFYFNGTHADYHRPTDTVDKINFTLMEKRVQFIFYTAWEMANRDDMLRRDIPLW